MLFPPIDPNRRFRERRAALRRRRRLRRAAVIALLLGALALLGGGAQFVGRGPGDGPATRARGAVDVHVGAGHLRATLPVEIRGVHVTMALASIPGRLEQYLELRHDGLTALELDVKDERGRVAFAPRSVSLARRVGAAGDFYSPRAVTRLAHRDGVYLIGRVVVFEDPMLASARSRLAVHASDGTLWHDAAGLAWANPYERRVWRYNVAVAVAAARAGFDEIMFDYVRFPSDGNLGSAVYGRRSESSKQDAIASFFRYATHRLRPLGARISAAVFGLSATRDLGIGQRPRMLARYVDAVYPMTYPSLFGSGELGLADPSGSPGATVSLALQDFRRALRGRRTLLVPWVQDFTFSRPFGSREVRAQIDAVRLAGAKGYMLWNPEGVYTKGVLSQQ